MATNSREEEDTKLKISNESTNTIHGSEDMKFKTWKESTDSLLGTIDNYCFQPFSISVVPDELRKWNENAYMPKALSIGPRYKGATRDLQQMEEIKWRYMRALFGRTEKGVQNSEKCMKAILELDGAVRASYVDEIKLDRYELAEIMLCDGCFMLELLISGSKQLNEKLKSKSPAGMEGRSVGRQDDAFADLTLLENQIPLLILNELAKLLFPQLFVYNKDGVCTIESLVLSLLGFYPIPSFITLKAGHFLELAYTSIFEKFLLIQMEHRSNNPLEDDYFEQESIIDVESDAKPNQIKLQRCANRLRAAGITIKALDTDEVKNNPRISFNFDMKFEKGTLYIPPLHITKTSEARWRNFIAWEHHKMRAKSFDINNGKQSSDMASSGNKLKCTNWVSSLFKGRICCTNDGNEDNNDHNENQSGKVTSTFSYKCKCTWAALLFSGLICCASDIQLLQDRKVIVNHTNMKNRDLVKFFHSITDGVETSIVDPGLCNMFNELNTYQAKRYYQRITIILWHYFTRILEPIFSLHSFLSKGYNYAAAIGLILTLIQTIYAMVAYHHPPG